MQTSLMLELSEKGVILMIQSIDINLDEEMAAEIEKRAAAIQLSPSSYIELVLLECLECGDQDTA